MMMSEIEHLDWTKIMTRNLARRSENYQVIQKKGKEKKKTKLVWSDDKVEEMLRVCVRVQIDL